MTTPTARPSPRPAPGRTELGAVTINDKVVEKIAGQIVADTPNAGAAASKILGVTVPGSALLGTRDADLTGRPKVSATVDGSVATLDISMSVRWPASIRTVTTQVRESVIGRVQEMTGLDVVEVRIFVTELLTTMPAPPRVQ